MIALWIIGGLLLLLILLLQIRARLDIYFGTQTQVWAKLAFFDIKIAPAPEKKPGKPKKKKAKPTSQTESAPKKKKLINTVWDLIDLLPAIWEALQKGLGATHKKLRLDPVDVSVTIGGDDPAEVAKTYGWANAVMWTVMPQLQALTNMPDPYIHLGMDYDASAITAEGQIGISLRLWEGLIVALSFGRPVLRWYTSTQKAQKQRAAKQPSAPQKTTQTKTA